MSDIVLWLRAWVQNIRRNPAPLSDAIPMVCAAADEITALRARIAEQEAEIARLREAIDHMTRVALGSTSHSRRAAWIASRGICALDGNDDWKSLPVPKGYHNALEASARKEQP